MLLSNQKKFIFIHIPKTAGSSITQALEPFADRREQSQFRRLLSHLPVPENLSKANLRVHAKAAWVRIKLRREVYDSYYKFAVVRNPYDYAVSYFYYLRQNPSSKRSAHARQWSFLEFLNYMAAKERVGGVTQSGWVTDRSGRQIVDELLRFESLDVEFPRLLKKLGITDATSLPHVNKSSRRDYREMYGEREREVADRLFQNDLKLFGYSF